MRYIHNQLEVDVVGNGHEHQNWMSINVIPGGHEHESQAVDELHPSQGVHPHEHQHSIQHRHWDKPGTEYNILDDRNDDNYVDLLENRSKLCRESNKKENTDAGDSLERKQIT